MSMLEYFPPIRVRWREYTSGYMTEPRRVHMLMLYEPEASRITTMRAIGGWRVLRA
jgi:hypothetical protein